MKKLNGMVLKAKSTLFFEEFKELAEKRMKELNI